MVTSTIRVEYIRADHWWEPTQWFLLEEYVSANGKVTVPVGFITDGATIPKGMRGLFSPVGRYFGAAIVHDYLLESVPQPTSKDDWDYSNQQFKEELKALNIMPWRLWIVLNSVRSWAAVKTNLVDKLPRK